jgi:hypothetical protein
MKAHDKLPSAASAAATMLAPATAAREKEAVRASSVAGGRPSVFERLDVFLGPLIDFFTSLRLTVVCLLLGLVLVFFGTMAQDPLGLYIVQDKFFYSFTVPAPAMVAAIKKTLQLLHFYLTPSTPADVMLGSRLPIFPGGYLIGGVLLINLLASHFKRFKLTRDKAGIWMVHFGLILLLVGQLGTRLVSRESFLHLRERGAARNYSESDRQVELAVIDSTEPDLDKIVAAPQGLLISRQEIRHAELPFVVHIKNFFPNAIVENRTPQDKAPPPATQGMGPQISVRELPRVTELNKRDAPAAIVEVETPQGSLGTWLVSEYIDQPQTFTFNKRTYGLVLRLRRYYTQFSLKLLQFQHDVYPGTDIPKNFSSRVQLQRPDTGENREVLIYMNNPLRYAGETYYQADLDKDDKGTILQVVHNPSWLTPYLSCVLVGLGLVYQFATHLFGFTLKRRPA